MSLPENDQPLLRYQRCRTCLSKPGQHNIFLTNTIQMQLEYLMDIEIENSNNLPSGICDECLTSLKQAFMFKEKCEMTHSILMQERELDEKLNSLQTSTLQEQCEEEDNQMDPDLNNENDIWMQFQQNSIFLNENLEEKSLSPRPCEFLHIKLEQVDGDDDSINNDDSHQINHVTQKNLSRLLQNHGVNEKFKMLKTCGYCERRFHRPHLLKEHIAAHLSEDPYFCKNCQMSFEGSLELRKHIAVVHENDFDIVEICSVNSDERVTNLEHECEEELCLNKTNTLNHKKRLIIPEIKLTTRNQEAVPKIISCASHESTQNT